MKKILGLIVLLSFTQANALVCTLNKENPNVKGQFDQSLFKNQPLEVLKVDAKQELILVKLDGTVLENYQFSSIKTPEDIKAIDQSVMAVITRNADNTLAIGVGKIDASNSQNISPLYSMAIGTEGKILSVMDFSQHMAFSCFNM